MALSIYGFDIETDTSTNGLDPRVSRVTSAAIWSPTEQHCIAHEDERRMLAELGELVNELPPGIFAGWNSSVFDLPFLATRASTTGVNLPMQLVPDPGIIPKYAFTPPHTCGYRAEIGRHQHADVAYAYRYEARHLGTKWSLKPVAKAFGIEVLEVDRENMHELAAAERNAYNLSDARAAYLLAERLDCWIAGWLDARHILELEEARA